MKKAFEFEGYTLDLNRGCLRAGDRVIELRPKSFTVLTYLVENAGRLVSKDEIIQAAWPDVVVTDESLAKCVSEVRAALDGSGNRLVRTVPKRGYVLDVPVSETNGQLTSTAAPGCAVAASAVGPATSTAFPLRGTMAPRGRLIAGPGVALLITIATLLAAVFSWNYATHAPQTDRPSIAVLPFVNASREPQQAYFSDGLTEDLIASLGRFSGIFVVGRNSAFAYKGKGVPADQVARELGVRYLVEGSIRRDDGRVRITAELIDATTRTQLWAESYDGVSDRIFAMQDEVTRSIVAMLIAHVSRFELARVLRKPSDSLDAYDYYLRGKALITMRHGDSRGTMLAQARDFFERSLGVDPRYAPALQGLAYTYAAAYLEPMSDGLFAAELRQPAILDRALKLGLQAVELDPYLAEAHATLAWILHWQHRRSEAITEFKHALVLNPNLADGRLAHMLVHDGRAGEAVELMQRMMRQDPFPPAIYFSYLGNAYYLTGQYDAAFDTLRIGAERMPGYRAIPVWLAAAAAQSGRPGEARKATATVLSMAPDFTVTGWLRHIEFDRRSDADRLADGLRKAGLPD